MRGKCANRGRRGRRLSATAALMLIFAAPALAAGPSVCNALTLYGNAAASGLCKQLSPTGQNLWVCEINDNPDVHTTFNGTTQFHVTVRIPDPRPGSPPVCENAAYLAGDWPNLTIQAGQPTTICGIDIRNYVARLNAVQAVPRVPPQTACRAGFTNALNSGRLSPPVAGSYLQTCNAPPNEPQACE